MGGLSVSMTAWSKGRAPQGGRGRPSGRRRGSRRHLTASRRPRSSSASARAARPRRRSGARPSPHGRAHDDWASCRSSRPRRRSRTGAGAPSRSRSGRTRRRRPRGARPFGQRIDADRVLVGAGCGHAGILRVRAWSAAVVGGPGPFSATSSRRGSAPDHAIVVRGPCRHKSRTARSPCAGAIRPICARMPTRWIAGAALRAAPCGRRRGPLVGRPGSAPRTEGCLPASGRPRTRSRRPVLARRSAATQTLVGVCRRGGPHRAHPAPRAMAIATIASDERAGRGGRHGRRCRDRRGPQPGAPPRAPEALAQTRHPRRRRRRGARSPRRPTPGSPGSDGGSPARPLDLARAGRMPPESLGSAP